MAIGGDHEVGALEVAVHQSERHLYWAVRVEPTGHVPQHRQILDVFVGGAAPFVDTFRQVGIPTGGAFEPSRERLER